MERYQAHSSQEQKHPLIGNLYIASSLKDMLSSREIVLQNNQSIIDRITQLEAKALISLWLQVLGIPPVAFVYVPGVRHLPRRDDPNQKEEITILDETTECRIRIPTRRFDINSLRDKWRSDVVLLNRYDTDPIKRTHALAIFFNGSVTSPRINLGVKILNENSISMS